ncbi:MAG: hypothetical protein DMD43_07190 [Gemmatimonadetes bacterium]|nr:MAG: hypothetical protein DMD43_07190 [Gemmatimonadota bacterium]
MPSHRLVAKSAERALHPAKANSGTSLATSWACSAPVAARKPNAPSAVRLSASSFATAKRSRSKSAEGTTASTAASAPRPSHPARSFADTGARVGCGAASGIEWVMDAGSIAAAPRAEQGGLV